MSSFRCSLSRALLRSLLLATGLLLIPSVAKSQHYLPGLTPNRGFARPEPGVAFVAFFYNFNAGSLRDSNGDKFFPERPDGSPIVAGDFNLFANVYVPGYTAKEKVLGAQYSIRWTQPFTNASLSVEDRDGQTGLVVFDPLFSPLILTWSPGPTDVTLTWGMWLPLGSENGGTLDAFASQTQLGGLLYFDADRRTALNVSGTWETNSAAFGKDSRMGDYLTLEYGFGHVTPLWNFGFTGYARWNITDHVGADAPPVRDHRLFTTAVGGEFGYLFASARLDITLRVLTALRAISAPKGTHVLLNIAWLAVPF